MCESSQEWASLAGRSGAVESSARDGAWVCTAFDLLCTWWSSGADRGGISPRGFFSHMWRSCARHVMLIHFTTASLRPDRVGIVCDFTLDSAPVFVDTAGSKYRVLLLGCSSKRSRCSGEDRKCVREARPWGPAPTTQMSSLFSIPSQELIAGN